MKEFLRKLEEDRKERENSLLAANIIKNEDLSENIVTYKYIIQSIKEKDDIINRYKENPTINNDLLGAMKSLEGNEREFLTLHPDDNFQPGAVFNKKVRSRSFFFRSKSLLNFEKIKELKALKCIYHVESVPDTCELVINGYLETKNARNYNAILKNFNCFVVNRVVNRDIALNLVCRETYRVFGPFGFETGSGIKEEGKFTEKGNVLVTLTKIVKQVITKLNNGEVESAKKELNDLVRFLDEDV